MEQRPQTEQDLRRDLAAIGVEDGMTLVVHSSLSSLGWVVGGAPTVVRTLLGVLGVLGERGTLAIPAATPQAGRDASRTAASGVGAR